MRDLVLVFLRLHAFELPVLRMLHDLLRCGGGRSERETNHQSESKSTHFVLILTDPEAESVGKPHRS
jgi:hypothetical protein